MTSKDAEMKFMLLDRRQQKTRISRHYKGTCKCYRVGQNGAAFIPSGGRCLIAELPPTTAALKEKR